MGLTVCRRNGHSAPIIREKLTKHCWLTIILRAMMRKIDDLSVDRRFPIGFVPPLDFPVTLCAITTKNHGHIPIGKLDREADVVVLKRPHDAHVRALNAIYIISLRSAWWQNSFDMYAGKPRWCYRRLLPKTFTPFQCPIFC